MVNIILEGYGVRLELLKKDKIEMLRCWRNDPKVQQYMAYREYITQDMQEKWFQSINNGVDNFYFIISIKGVDVGMINIKDVDRLTLVCESGVIMYDEKSLNTGVTYNAHILLFDFVFSTLGLKKILAHTLKSNVRSSRLGQFLGYKLTPGEEDKDHQLWTLEKDDYFNNANRISFVRKFTRE